MQSIHLTETYGNRTSRDLLSEKEIIKYKNIIKHTKINNFDDVTKEKISIAWGSGYEKINLLFKSQQPDIDKIYFC